MHEVWGGDEYGFDGRLFVEHFFEVGVNVVFGECFGIAFDLVFIFAEEAADSFVLGELPDIADGDPLDARDVFGSDAEGIALGTAADEGAFDGATAIGGLGDGAFAGIEEQAATSEVGTGAEEVAPIHETGEAAGGVI